MDKRSWRGFFWRFFEIFLDFDHRKWRPTTTTNNSGVEFFDRHSLEFCNLERERERDCKVERNKKKNQEKKNKNFGFFRLKKRRHFGTLNICVLTRDPYNSTRLPAKNPRVDP